jgi:hypothetical protein
MTESAPLSHDGGVFAPAPFRVVASWPAPAFIENVAAFIVEPVTQSEPDSSKAKPIGGAESSANIPVSPVFGS